MKNLKQKKSIILFGILCAVVMLFVNSSKAEKKADEQVLTKTITKARNLFFEEWKTPFGVPPFDQIKDEHFMPAFKRGMETEIKEIDAITNNTEVPTFENTLVAMEKTGELLNKVSRVFFHLNGADTSDTRQAIANDVTPLLSKHSNSISLNEKLFQRVKAVYEHKDKLNLNLEQKKLLEETYKAFVRSGANLKPEEKERVKKINEELSVLGLKFRNNLLAETNGFKMYIEKEEDLAGLPQPVKNAAAAAAERDGQKGNGCLPRIDPAGPPFCNTPPGAT